MLGENPQLGLRADLGPARDRFFNAQVSRAPQDEATRRGRPCKSPADRLYYQAISLFWRRNGPVFVTPLGH
jgi:hypothetical protein